MEQKLESKLKENFPSASILKSSSTRMLESQIQMERQCKSWAIKRFSNSSGIVNAFQLSHFIKENRISSTLFPMKLLELFYTHEPLKLLTKIKISFDSSKEQINFSLPEFSFPSKSKDLTSVSWSTVEKHRKELLSGKEVWGILTLNYEANILVLQNFEPFCPFTPNVKEFIEKRKNFSLEEWIQILLSSINYNPEFFSKEQKFLLLQRLLPFLQNNLNLVEICGKGTGKTYLNSLSQNSEVLSSSSITRASIFYNGTKKEAGVISKFDVLSFDEIQSYQKPKSEASELFGLFKNYMENGTFSSGNFSGNFQTSFVFLGNASTEELENPNGNFLKDLNAEFRKPEFLDRISGFIKPKLPRLEEDSKFEGWSLSTDYLMEIFHLFREEFSYDCLVEELINVPKGSDTRDVQSIKKLCSAFVKLLFPHWTSLDEVDRKQFEEFCLKPSMEMRKEVRRHLQLLDKSYRGKSVPNLTVRS